MLGIKQETLAQRIGSSQSTISKLEEQQEIDDDKLNVVADALGVPTAALKNFSPQAAINNQIFDQHNTVINYQFNPLEKIIDLYTSLILEKDRLLSEKDEVIAQLKAQLSKS